MGEAVAALDAHVVGDRTEAVSGIEIAVSAGVFGATPESLAGVGKQLIAKIVEVGAFAVEEIAEFTGVNHAQDERLVVAVAAVFKHDAVLAGLFRGAHDAPAIFERGDAGDFNGDVFAVSHGCERHGRMPTPRSGGDDEIDVIAGDQGFVVMRAVGEEFGTFLSGGNDEAGGVFGFVFDHIADGDDLRIGGEEIAEERGSAAADPDEADAWFAFLEGEVRHGFAVEEGLGESWLSPAGRLLRLLRLRGPPA